MPITKKSRKPSAMFDSRFRDGDGVNFPLRQYLRCREDFSAGLVHLALLGAFALTLVAFGRTVDHLFDAHGAHLNPWLRRGSLALVILAVLSVLWRIGRKIGDLRDTRQAMAHYQADFQNDED